MKRAFFLTFLLFVSIVHAAPESRPELGKYPQVYSSGNYKVTWLRIGKESEKKVLIKVTGVDNEHDGQIFLHEMKCDVSNCTSFKYETKEIPGKERWWTIQQTPNWDRPILKLFPPGIDKEGRLYELERPKDFDPNAFYDLYTAQKSKRK